MMLLPNVIVRERRVGEGTSYVLPEGQVCGWELRAGAEVRVAQGRVWLTQEKDAEDYIVVAGSGFVVGCQGKVVVEAVGGAAEIVL
jgi:hypothetical protein